MKTPSHAAIGWLLSRQPWWPRHLPASAVVAGSIAPDVPIMIAFSGIALWQAIVGGDGSTLATFRAAYESSPFVITSHQLLHAPFSLAALLIAAIAAGLLDVKLSRWLRSFLYGAMAHAVVDVFTHVDDGPLLLWPFDATTRFASLISHWDAGHCAALCVFIEALVCMWASHDVLVLRQSQRSRTMRPRGEIISGG